MFYQQYPLRGMSPRNDAVGSIGCYEWHKEIAGNTKVAAQFKQDIGIACHESATVQLLALFGDNSGQDVWYGIDQGCVFMVAKQVGPAILR